MRQESGAKRYAYMNEEEKPQWAMRHVDEVSLFLSRDSGRFLLGIARIFLNSLFSSVFFSRLFSSFFLICLTI